MANFENAIFSQSIITRMFSIITTPTPPPQKKEEIFEYTTTAINKRTREQTSKNGISFSFSQETGGPFRQMYSKSSVLQVSLLPVRLPWPSLSGNGFSTRCRSEHHQPAPKPGRIRRGPGSPSWGYKGQKECNYPDGFIPWRMVSDIHSLNGSPNRIYQPSGTHCLFSWTSQKVLSSLFPSKPPYSNHCGLFRGISYLQIPK